MIRAGYLPHTLTVLVPVQTTDRYGDKVASFSADNPSNFEVNAFVQPAQGDEVNQNRDAVEYKYKAFTNSRVDAHARVVYDGEELFVDGEPLRWDTPNGTHHYELNLRVWKG